MLVKPQAVAFRDESPERADGWILGTLGSSPRAGKPEDDSVVVCFAANAGEGAGDGGVLGGVSDSRKRRSKLPPLTPGLRRGRL
jgi:hypothetical protein